MRLCYNRHMNSNGKYIYNGFYDFKKLREGDYIYVDKTKYLHRLVTDPEGGLYFVSRPRRFGKSLMISTLKYLFQGRRDLFKGTYIDTQTDYDWKKYPVIHLDFAAIDVTTRELFDERFSASVIDSLQESGFEHCSDTASPTTNLVRAIRALSGSGRGVVVLVDEYDAPIDHALAHPEMVEYVRSRLAPFYATLKTMSDNIRFMMMTGVAKFTKLSVFSSMNNTADITTDPDYAALLGYTEEELETNFSEHMHRCADTMGMPYEAYRAELKRRFNGYRFTMAETKVYNPISIAYTLTSNGLTFDAPWTKTGRPTMLATFLKTHDVMSLDFEKGIPATLDSLEPSSELTNLTAKSILYQTGYLTIVDVSQTSERITLGFPDEEVRRDMYRFLTDIRAQNSTWCQEALDNLSAGALEPFLEALPSLYAGLPAHSKDGKLPESHYQGILKVVMEAGGFKVICEQIQSSLKRSDLVVETPEYCYIFELKSDGKTTATDAVQQIIDCKYDAPHRGKGKPVFAVGLVFDPTEHTLSDTAWKQLC